MQSNLLDELQKSDIFSKYDVILQLNKIQISKREFKHHKCISGSQVFVITIHYICFRFNIA